MVAVVEEEMKHHHLASDRRIKVGVNAFLSFKDFNMIFWSGFTPCLYRRDLYCLEKCDRYKRRPKIKINYFFSFCSELTWPGWGRNQAQESWDKIESHSCHRHLHQHNQQPQRWSFMGGKTGNFEDYIWGEQERRNAPFNYEFPNLVISLEVLRGTESNKNNSSILLQANTSPV